MKLHSAIRDLITQVRNVHPGVHPSLVAAAGMITSPLGLMEVPHVPAPAGAEDLARGARHASLPEISDLPFLLFPGVRCGEFASDDISRLDVMRGEETLCVGLLADEHFKPPFTILNLGSHWKLIRVDDLGRIAQSRTSLTGELIHATQTATILASGLPDGKLESLDYSWCERGMTETRRSGLTRALFCVRLLEMQERTSPKQRMSFLVGGYVADELEALRRTDYLSVAGCVIIAGSGAVSEAWNTALLSKGVTSRMLAEGEIEAAFLAGIAGLIQATIG